MGACCGDSTDKPKVNRFLKAANEKIEIESVSETQILGQAGLQITPTETPEDRNLRLNETWQTLREFIKTHNQNDELFDKFIEKDLQVNGREQPLKILRCDAIYDVLSGIESFKISMKDFKDCLKALDTYIKGDHGPAYWQQIFTSIESKLAYVDSNGMFLPRRTSVTSNPRQSVNMQRVLAGMLQDNFGAGTGGNHIEIDSESEVQPFEIVNQAVGENKLESQRDMSPISSLQNSSQPERRSKADRRGIHRTSQPQYIEDVKSPGVKSHASSEGKRDPSPEKRLSDIKASIDTNISKIDELARGSLFDDLKHITEEDEAARRLTTEEDIQNARAELTAQIHAQK